MEDSRIFVMNVVLDRELGKCAVTGTTKLDSVGEDGAVQFDDL